MIHLFSGVFVKKMNAIKPYQTYLIVLPLEALATQQPLSLPSGLFAVNNPIKAVCLYSPAIIYSHVVLVVGTTPPADQAEFEIAIDKKLFEAGIGRAKAIVKPVADRKPMTQYKTQEELDATVRRLFLHPKAA